MNLACAKDRDLISNLLVGLLEADEIRYYNVLEFLPPFLLIPIQEHFPIDF